MRNPLLITIILVVPFAAFGSLESVHAQKRTLETVEASSILRRLKDGKRIAVKQAVVRGQLDFTRLPVSTRDDGSEAIVIDEDVSIFNSKISGRVTTHPSDGGVPVVFKGDVDFAGTTFADRAFFSSARFESRALFFESVFKRRTLFTETYFASSDISASFRGAKFHDEANFNKMETKRSIDFTEASFKGRASFEFGVVFHQSAEFDNARFDRCEFDGATFQAGGSFDGAEFRGKGSFDRAHFRENASFNNAEFMDWVSFERIKCASLCNYSSARFLNGAKFNGATFSDRSIFHKVVFDSSSSFTNAEFGGLAVFVQAKAKQKLTFDKSRFDGIAHFRELTADLVNFNSVPPVIFSERADFRRSRIGEADFGSAIFTTLDLTGSDFLRRLSLKDTVYRRLHMDWDDERRVFEPAQNIDALRALEESFRESGKLSAANDVYYRLRSLRREKRGPVLSSLEYVVLALGFGYGVRPWNVVVSSTVLIAMFSLLYLRGGECD